MPYAVASRDLLASMSGSHVNAEQSVSCSESDPASTSDPPCPALAALPIDVLAEVAAQLTVADVGNLLLTSKGVRDSVRANEPLWAAQYAMRWVRLMMVQTRVRGPINWAEAIMQLAPIVPLPVDRSLLGTHELQ